MFIRILFALLFTIAIGYADSKIEAASKQLMVAANLTRDEAAKNLQAATNARVLGAKTITKDGKDFYVFKVLTEKDGRVRLITIDPATGRVISK